MISSSLVQSGSAPGVAKIPLSSTSTRMYAGAERLRLAEDPLLHRRRACSSVCTIACAETGALALRRAGHSERGERDGEAQINVNYSHNGRSRVYKRPR